MNTCATCKHWDKPKPIIGGNGECRLSKGLSKKMEATDSPAGYEPVLKTSADFGCTEHASK